MSDVDRMQPTSEGCTFINCVSVHVELIYHYSGDGWTTTDPDVAAAMMGRAPGKSDEGARD